MLDGVLNRDLTRRAHGGYEKQACGKKTYSLEVTHVGHVLHGGSIEDQIGDACRLGVLLVVFDEDLKKGEGHVKLMKTDST